MKNLLFILLLVAAVLNVKAQEYVPSDGGSEVKFSIKNFGLNVTGSFKGLKGAIKFLPGNPAASSINVTVDAATVNTGNNARDKHLVKEEYFDAASYPTLKFVSVNITGKDGGYTVEGNLTIKGVTKRISFPFTATAITNGYQLQGQFKLNRKDFKVGGNSWVLSDGLTVSLNIAALK
ncbi:MAG TPA: YceI family protein [Ferruginibacter sp.]|nr:YceI family protein [Ferruginibacter sp.]